MTQAKPLAFRLPRPVVRSGSLHSLRSPEPPFLHPQNEVHVLTHPTGLSRRLTEVIALITHCSAWCKVITQKSSHCYY